MEEKLGCSDFQCSRQGSEKYNFNLSDLCEAKDQNRFVNFNSMQNALPQFWRISITEDVIAHLDAMG